MPKARTCAPFAPVADPDDPDYDEWSEWLGGEFDPEAFDLDLVNERLRPRRRRRR